MKISIIFTPPNGLYAVYKTSNKETKQFPFHGTTEHYERILFCAVVTDRDNELNDDVVGFVLSDSGFKFMMAPLKQGFVRYEIDLKREE